MVVTAAQAVDKTVVGGKAAALAALATAGFDVPAFFVIPADAFSGAADAPRARGGLKAELAAHLAALGLGPFAVRSSGRAEDGVDHSHAGQFATVLNVEAPDVLDAARKVWASGFSQTVAAYRALKTGAEAEAPAIVVQTMVPARAAGVAFSADPVARLRGRTVIAAIAGLGEALVSGEADGEDWTIDASGAILTAPLQPQVLTKADARAVADLARRAEAAFGVPQDIEWAFDGPRLYILQSRPITTPLNAPPAVDTALMVFDNSNIVESYPGLVSPLTYSFARYVYARVYHAFVRILGVSETKIAANTAVFENMLTRLDGRVYYNLGNWYRALALLPGFSLNRGYMETMMGVDDPLPVELSASIGAKPPTGIAALREWARLVRLGFGLGWQALLLPRTRRRFYARLEAALALGRGHGSANLTTLAAEYRRIESTLLDQWDAPLINDFLCMITFGASRGILKRWGGEAGLAFHNDVMIGQGDIVSAEPAQRIARIGQMVRAAGIADVRLAGALAGHPAIAAEIDSYIGRFGDRCTQELKLESIPLSEDPTQLYAAIHASAARVEIVRPVRAEPDWAALIQSPLRRGVARAITTYAKARVRDRENLRFERTRIFGHARRVFLSIGRELTALGKIDTPRDVYLLTVEEVLGAIEGFGLSQNLRGLIELRRAEMATAGPDLPERLIHRGAAISAVTTAASAVGGHSGQTQTGTGCSAGTVTADARVIHDPRTESLAQGQILVARNTDPGWIAVFANAAAIVVERGSLLSHSAIVARELGIPCVVGIRNATTWIEDGARITVNGTTGEVRKCDD